MKTVSTCLTACLMALAWTTAAMPKATLGSTLLIPIQNHRDLVYDARRALLYITTSDGKVQRYDIQSQTLLPPFDVGNGQDRLCMRHNPTPFRLPHISIITRTGRWER